MASPVRKAAVAGSWYPGTAAALAADVDGYLAQARVPPVPGRLVALISPHAGLVYSGPVAAHGYSLLRGRRGLTLVLVGPSHRSLFQGVAVWTRGSFETPLGPIPVDEDLAQRLVDAHPLILDERRPHESEHSLEMQLPFIRHLVGDARLVPALMGTQSREEVEALAMALAATLSPRADVLLVASSDLSHYHAAHKAKALDAPIVDCVARLDADGLMERLEHNRGHACGGGPMVAVMKAARALGADSASILKYGDSGDAADHDKSRVVGYLSAALSAAA